MQNPSKAMNYFDYVSKEQQLSLMYEIYTVVRSLKKYAMSIYGSSYEDVLDKAFFHILEHYNPEFEKLEHYATRIVGTIELQKYKHEITHDLALNLALDEQSSLADKDEILNAYIDGLEVSKKEDLESCIKCMIPFFAKDYKVFLTQKSMDRSMSYKEVFEKYSFGTIKSAIEFLQDAYGNKMKALIDVSKKYAIKRYGKNRYKSNLDEGVTYLGTINDIVLYEKSKNVRTKIFYKFDIKENIARFISTMYQRNKEVHNYLKIESTRVFVTLTGRIAVGVKEFKEILESEMVGMLLSRKSHLKVVYYEKGDSLLISCSKEQEDSSLEIEQFEKIEYLTMRRMVAKQVVTE